MGKNCPLGSRQGLSIFNLLTERIMTHSICSKMVILGQMHKIWARIPVSLLEKGKKHWFEKENRTMQEHHNRKGYSAVFLASTVSEVVSELSVEDYDCRGPCRMFLVSTGTGEPASCEWNRQHKLRRCDWRWTTDTVGEVLAAPMT